MAAEVRLVSTPTWCCTSRLADSESVVRMGWWSWSEEVGDGERVRGEQLHTLDAGDADDREWNSTLS